MSTNACVLDVAIALSKAIHQKQIADFTVGNQNKR